MMPEGKEQIVPPTDSGLFSATHWSVVLRARDKSEIALGQLSQSYRQRLIVWLRAQNYFAP